MFYSIRHGLGVVAGVFVVIAMAASSGCGKKSNSEKQPAKSAGTATPQAPVAPAADQGTQPDQAAMAARAGQPESGQAAGTQPAATTEKIPAGSVQAQMLIIGWKGARPGAKRTKEQAKALSTKIVGLAASKSFGTLVKTYSDGPKANGGKTPAMTQKEASKIFTPVFGLQVGQVSQPVEGPDGYYVFKRIK